MRAIRLSQLGCARRWAEAVAQTGDSIPIVDDDGVEIAVIVPATEPVTEILLDELIRSGRWTAEALAEVRPWAGRPNARYNRITGTFVLYP